MPEGFTESLLTPKIQSNLTEETSSFSISELDDILRTSRFLPLRSTVQILAILDWNGTLFDDTLAVLEADNAVLKHFNVAPISLLEFQESVCAPKHKFYELHGCPVDGVLENAELIAALAHKRYESLATECELRPGAKDFLEFLRSLNARIIILSNHMTDAIEFQLQRFKIDSFFSDILANSDPSAFISGMRKENRLKDYLKRSSEKWNQKIIVGDSVEEIEIARNCSLKSVALTGGIHSESRLHAAEPDLLCSTLLAAKAALVERYFEG